MSTPDKTKVLATLAAAAGLLIAGCGSDSSGETSATQVSIPTPTSPVAPATTAATPTQQQGKTPTRASTVVAGPGGCQIPDVYQDLKFTGIGCTDAVALATAWDMMGSSCNTIDDPNSPQGFNRTCTVNGFTCTAKRDVHSDGRFVTCTQGNKSVRFTWLPT